MGLEQGEKPLLGETSTDFHPTPPWRGYPGLTNKIPVFSLPRRGFFKLLGGAVIGAGLAGSLRKDASADPDTPEISLVMSDQALALNQQALELFGEHFSLTGNPISKGFSENGKLVAVFENMKLEVDGDGLSAAPILDTANEQGLDKRLADRYANLNPIPPRADITFNSKDLDRQVKESIDFWQLDQPTADFISQLNQLLKTGAVVGYTNSGTEESLIEVFRTPSVAFLRGSEGPNANQFVMINVGVQTQGLVWPAKYAFSKTETATGGGITPTPEQTAQLRPSELRYISPKGYAQIDYAPGTKVTIGVEPEAETQLDELLRLLNIRLVFTENPNLRPGSGLGLGPGNMILMSCSDFHNNKCFISTGYAKFAVDPQTRTVLSEFNVKQDIQFDKELAEHNGYLLATAVANKIAELLYGAEIPDIEDDTIRKQAAAIRNILRDTIKPFKFISR